jgi:hypothetical protein
MSPTTIVSLFFDGVVVSCYAYELRRKKSPERNAGFKVWNKPWLRWTTYFLAFVAAAFGYLEYTMWNTYGRSSRFDKKARLVNQLISHCDLASNDSETAFNQCVNEGEQKLNELRSTATNPGERMLCGRLRVYLESVVECHESRKQGKSMDETNSCAQETRRSRDSLAQTLK